MDFQWRRRWPLASKEVIVGRCISYGPHPKIAIWGETFTVIAKNRIIMDKKKNMWDK